MWRTEKWPSVLSRGAEATEDSSSQGWLSCRAWPRLRLLCARALFPPVKPTWLPGSPPFPGVGAHSLRGAWCVSSGREQKGSSQDCDCVEAWCHHRHGSSCGPGRWEVCGHLILHEDPRVRSPGALSSRPAPSAPTLVIAQVGQRETERGSCRVF